MTIETHFETAKQCQNLFGLNEAATAESILKRSEITRNDS